MPGKNRALSLSVGSRWISRTTQNGTSNRLAALFRSPPNLGLVTQGPTAPPGWYPVQSGVLLWWDGAAWRPEAPLPSGSPDQRTWSMLAHLGFLVLWFVGSLVIRQTVGRGSDVVRRHATEALNANLTLALYWNAGPLLAMVLSSETGNEAWNVLWAGMPIALAWIVINSIRGFRHASREEPFRYPAIIRFVPGGWPRQR
jgi:uncharacterized Tic20 family protein